jgi:hypothetical protein
MKTKVKKIISSIVLVVMCMSFLSVFVQADAGQSSNFSYTVNSNGNGGVNGFSNGKFYYLSPGRVTYDLTTLSGNGSSYIWFELWRHEYTQQNPNYGEHFYYGCNFTNSPARLEYSSLDVISTRYYFKINGGPSNTTISGKGTVHDHGVSGF